MSEDELGRAAADGLQHARQAGRYLAELTGREPGGVVWLEAAEDGWQVGIEVVEERRVPSANDIIAIYEIRLAADGGLLSVRRTRRYYRSSMEDWT
ncbi:hypothetical protein BC739_002528 [Kutzneria viridogrisea]|uniref:Gas vesicle synthesis protein n=2 Tax=Kutzneria TaxID=43356 RepID=W5WH51_9PSEU|nr:gas vesicle protein GvpO [Kutzneria albida]AHI00153.1 hypothetical protein KALB_6794 [Kutzneria albida DSM 43870]MBA8925329.1 hypothetical protein [Kutzneria viridogrisea]